MYAMQLRQPTIINLWGNNPLVLAVRYIAVANVIRFFSLGWERSRSIGVSNSQVITGSTKCLGNFTSLDTPLVPGGTLLGHKNCLLRQGDMQICTQKYRGAFK